MLDIYIAESFYILKQAGSKFCWKTLWFLFTVTTASVSLPVVVHEKFPETFFDRYLTIYKKGSIFFTISRSMF